MIQDVRDECSGIVIHFPSSGVVGIRGPTEVVDKAKKLVSKLVSRVCLFRSCSFCSIYNPPQHYSHCSMHDPCNTPETWPRFERVQILLEPTTR